MTIISRKLLPALLIATLSIATGCNGDDSDGGPDAAHPADSGVDGGTDGGVDGGAGAALVVQLTSVSPGASNSDRQPTVSGRASVGAHITLHADAPNAQGDQRCAGPLLADLGVPTPTPAEQQAGIVSFSRELGPQPANERLNIRALAVDSAGNRACTPTAMSFIFDPTAPSAPAVALLTTSPSNNLNPTFSITGEAGAAVRIYRGACYATVFAPTLGQLDGNGALTLAGPTAAADGTTDYFISQTDALGNESSCTWVAYLTDTTPPPAPTLNTDPAGSGTTRVVRVIGQVSGAPLGRVDIYYSTFPARRCTELSDGAALGLVLQPNGSFAHTFTLPDAPAFYFFTARVRDAVGNQGPCTPVAVSYQLLSP
jgi:hypothetical protein